MKNLEDITKAAQTADLLVSDLRAAYRCAHPVASIIIERLLNDAAVLRNAIDALVNAMEAEA